MGYSFALKNANAVGHLVERNVLTFVEETLRNDELFTPNVEFIENLVRNPSDDFYTTQMFWDFIKRDFYRLNSDWDKIKEKLYRARNNPITVSILENKEVFDFFFKISNVLSRCRVKTFLLPGFESSELNDDFVDPHFLRELVHIHPGPSSLILQLKERFQNQEMSVLNAFSKFDVAYKQIDKWPGVLLWDSNQSLFYPIDSSKELVELYHILKFEKNSFNYLRAKIYQKNKGKRYSYLFHFSDLHFGHKLVKSRTTRAVKILENQYRQLDDVEMAIPIITGDLVDSPTEENRDAYNQFIELLKPIGFETPIQILGNHDFDPGGYFKKLTKQKTVISALSTEKKIEVIPALNLALIKFDSNTGGKYAQGEIGLPQLQEVGSIIDGMSNNKELTFIALLHHHPLEIDNPEWYAKEWYEALLGTRGYEKTMKLVDSDIFLEWLKKREIKLALHGHKHIPKIQSTEDLVIVAAGSLTGCIKHVDQKKTYLSYNLIKYDTENKKPVSCSIFAEDLIGSGAKNVLVRKL